MSWSQPGGGCFAASGDGVKLGAILVGRRGRGFCCSEASSAGAGATRRLGAMVPDATALPAAVCRGCPASGCQGCLRRHELVGRAKPAAVLVDRLRPPTESAAAVLLVWFVFGLLQSHQLCISQTSQVLTRSYLQCTVGYQSLSGRMHVKAVCVFIMSKRVSLAVSRSVRLFTS